MMAFQNILAIDTATRSLKLALSFGSDRLIKSEQVVDKSHGRVIIKKIGELFDSAGSDLNGLEALVVATGPGSFTGIRIGLAVAKGMAVALNIPVAGVNVFELLSKRFGSETRPVNVLIPFRRGEFFVGTIRVGKYDLDEVSIVSVEQVSEIGRAGRLVGVGLDAIEQLSGNGSPVAVERIEFDASELIHLGAEKLHSGDFPALKDLEPLYLRKSQAELRFERRHKA